MMPADHGVVNTPLIADGDNGGFAIARSSRSSVGCSFKFLQDHDLLPYFLREPGADALDIADHFGDRPIVKTLAKKDRNLRSQRQHFRTIVEISRHLKSVEHKRRRRWGVRTNDEFAWILRQLMHINHMDDGAKLVQRR